MSLSPDPRSLEDPITSNDSSYHDIRSDFSSDNAPVGGGGAATLEVATITGLKVRENNIGEDFARDVRETSTPIDLTPTTTPNQSRTFLDDGQQLESEGVGVVAVQNGVEFEVGKEEGEGGGEGTLERRQVYRRENAVEMSPAPSAGEREGEGEKREGEVEEEEEEEGGAKHLGGVFGTEEREEESEGGTKLQGGVTGDVAVVDESL